MKYADMSQDTPRLVVMFKRDGENELFQWGIVGRFPILTLVGCLVRIQAELPLLEPGDTWYSCPELALVVAWDENTRKFDWFIHPDIPVDPMVGMLETVKTLIINTRAAQQAVAQQLILGPDGRPVKR